MLCGSTLYGQNDLYDEELIFFEGFNEDRPPALDLNNGESDGRSGVSMNKWYVTENYKGGKGIKPMPSQKNVNGNINKPDDGYLAIRSMQQINNGVQSASYDPNQASNEVAQLVGTLAGNAFCFKGHDKIKITFWWTGEGDANSYVELIYSINGGSPWKVAKSENNRTRFDRVPSDTTQPIIWNYESFVIDEMGDKENVKIAFRWKNTRQNKPARISFGVDDIFVVGLRDVNKPKPQIFISDIIKYPFNPPMTNDTSMVGGNLKPLNPDTIGSKIPRKKGDTLLVCKKQVISVKLTHSIPMCDGNYQLVLVGIGVLRAVPYELVQTYGPQTFQALINCDVPEGIYRLVANRQSPYFPKSLVTDTIGFIKVRDCADSLYNLKLIAAPMDDTLSLRGGTSICTGSYFIVTFNSRTCFGAGNVYSVELSDANGKFEDENGNFVGQVLDESPDPRDYPNPIMPKSFTIKMPEGRNPDKPKPVPGCKYKIRARSTESPRFSQVLPFSFCIKDCSIETNETKPITVCITNPDSPTVVKVPYWAFRFDRQISYNDLNDMEWELWEGLVKFIHRGKFGSYNIKDDTLKLRGSFPPPFPNPQDTLLIVIPNLDSLLKWGSPPGSYFIRIVSTGGDLSEGNGEFTDKQGTVVPIEIGMPGTKPLILTNIDSLNKLCSGEDLSFRILSSEVRFEKKSKYAWHFLFYEFPPNYGQMSAQEVAEWESHLQDSIKAWRDAINKYSTGYVPSAKEEEQLTKLAAQWENELANLDSSSAAYKALLAKVDSLNKLLDTYQLNKQWKGQVMPPGENPYPYSGRVGISYWGVPGSYVKKTRFVVLFAQEVSGSDYCRGPVGNPVVIPIQYVPPIKLDGFQNTPCNGQPLKLRVGFVNDTYYRWTLDSTAVVPQDSLSNNEVVVTYPEPGRKKILLRTVNRCGNKDTTIFLRVFPQPYVSANDTFYLCKNADPNRVQLRANLDSSSYNIKLEEGDKWEITMSWLDESNRVIGTTRFNKPEQFKNPALADFFPSKDVEKVRLATSSIFIVGNPVNGEPDRQDKPCVDTVDFYVKRLSIEPAIKEGVTICAGKSTQLQVSGADYYIWKEDTTLSSLTIPNPLATPKKTRTYTATAFKVFQEIGGNQPCQEDLTITVNVLEPKTDTIPALFCEGKRFTLQTDKVGYQYEWFDVDRNTPLGKQQSQPIRRAGLYKLTVSNPDTANACSFDYYYRAKTIGSKAEKQTINECAGTNIILKGPECDSCKYLWNTPAKETTKDITIRSEGEFSVVVTILNGEGKEFCTETVTYNVELAPECKQKMYQMDIPNAFTPNDDPNKVNENWVVWIPPSMKAYKAMIFDRWGHKVFHAEYTSPEQFPKTINPLDGKPYPCILWDGRYNNAPVTENAFIYVIEVTNIEDRKITFTGNVTVLR